LRLPHAQILSVSGFSRISQYISLEVLYSFQTKHVGVNFNHNNCLFAPLYTCAFITPIPIVVNARATLRVGDLLQ